MAPWIAEMLARGPPVGTDTVTRPSFMCVTLKPSDSSAWMAEAVRALTVTLFDPGVALICA